MKTNLKYRKAIWRTILLSSLVFIMSQCHEVFEVRLDETTVSVIMPVDSLKTPVATQTFWWENTYGATHYHIQIVQPHFDSVFTLVVDEHVDTNKFYTTLNPGSYQWRIKAKNSATETPWETRFLIIDSTIDLSTQQVVLVSPKDADTSNNLQQSLSWQPLYNAQNYTVEVWQPDLTGSMVTSQNVTSSSLSVTLNDDEEFLWRIQAENGFSTSPFSQRNGYIDTIRPATPTPVAPAQLAILTDPNVNFSWLRPSDGGSSIRDSLVLGTDSLFFQIYQTYTTKGTSVSDSLNTGTFYWKLYSKDKAGNQSAASTTRKFTVQ